MLAFSTLVAFNLPASDHADRAATAQMQIAVIKNGIALKQQFIQTLERDIAASNVRILAHAAKKKANPKNASSFDISIRSETNSRDSMKAKLAEAQQYIAEREREKASREAELRNANANIARERARNPSQPNGLSLEEALNRKKGS